MLFNIYIIINNFYVNTKKDYFSFKKNYNKIKQKYIIKCITFKFKKFFKSKCDDSTYNNYIKIISYYDDMLHDRKVRYKIAIKLYNSIHPCFCSE